MIRTIEHQQDSIEGKWEKSGVMEHCLKCHGQCNWLQSKKLSWETRYKKRRVRESSKIKRSKCSVVNQIQIVMMGTSWKQIHGHLFEKH